MSAKGKETQGQRDRQARTGGQPRIPLASPAAWLALIALAVFLQPATAVARLMVRDYGMSAVLGPVLLGEERGPSFLGIKPVESRACSEQTALEVDREVQAMVLEARERAREIIRLNRERLDAMAVRLLGAEVVEEEEITRLWGPKSTRPETIDGRGRAEAPSESPPLPVAAGEARTAWAIPHAVAGTGDDPETR